MALGLARTLRNVPLGLGALTLVSLVPLLAWDAVPAFFPPTAHDVLAAFPLATIAVACILDRSLRSASRAETGRAVIVAVAFLFWAANQLWPSCPLATLFNDVAVALFVLDVFLVLLPPPRPAAPQVLGESPPRKTSPAAVEALLARATEDS